MVIFNIQKILKEAEYNYAETRRRYSLLLQQEGGKFKWIEEPRDPHPVMELVHKFREVLLRYGFREIIHPSFILEEDIYKQYGPEARLILDRCYYLAALPRPDIGLREGIVRELSLDKEQIEAIQTLLKKYKLGEVESDDLLEALMGEVGLSETDAILLLRNLYPFLERKPQVTKFTLRSHMTAAWFPLLSRIHNVYPLPIKLFTTGYVYRREQKLSPHHLYESMRVSLVVLSEDINLVDGEVLCKTILSEIGLPTVIFKKKPVASQYYAENLEEEIFVRKNSSMIEIGDIGLYSPISLAKYNIPLPVFNAGFGVERIAMLITGIKDIRQLAYPDFYPPTDLKDEEIASMLRPIKTPSTEIGKLISRSIEETFLKYGSQEAPCSYTVFDGSVNNNHLVVTVYEEEEGVKLAGPALFNEIIVYDGSIIGIPPRQKGRSLIPEYIYEKCAYTNLSYLKLLSLYVGWLVEHEIRKHNDKRIITFSVGLVKRPRDINLFIPETVRLFIVSTRKKIDIRGPAFFSVRVSINGK